MYPQKPLVSISPSARNCKLDIEADNKLLVNHGFQKTSEQLTDIERIFNTGKSNFLCDKPTVADYYLALILIQLENVNMKFDNWPMVQTWYKEYKTNILALLI